MIRVHRNVACPAALQRRHPCRALQARLALHPQSHPARHDAPRCDHRTAHQIDHLDMRGLRPVARLQRHLWAAQAQETVPWNNAHHTTSSHPSTTHIRPTLGRLLSSASPLCSISVLARSAPPPAGRASRPLPLHRRCSCRRTYRICRNTSTICHNHSFRLKVGVLPALVVPKKKLAPPAWPSSVAKLTSTRQRSCTRWRAFSRALSCRCRSPCHSHRCRSCRTTRHPRRRRMNHRNILSNKKYGN